ncbi:MAG: hypothetical protein JRE40_06555 [Deltaproteobacteria bacterium]|nr:hypothetical protein [Deltaproteobacteria bacterium]
MPLTKEEIKQIASRTADEVMARLHGAPDLAFHIAEHEVLAGALVVNEAVARATPCKGFTFEGEIYAWSPGCVGLISSKKNPEQLREFCALGIEPAGAGAQERFKRLKGAISEAHKEWEERGEGLKGWWQTVAKTLAEKGIEL